MSACRDVAISYSSPSLPEPLLVAKSEDGQLIQSLLVKRDKETALIHSAGQILLDNPSLAYLMGFQRIVRLDEPQINSVEDAIAKFDASCWERLLSDSKFTMLMPSARRSKFLADLKTSERPPFTEEHVLPTVQSWLMEQDLYFAERIDGIFHSLSPDHITNSPAGFGGKMILKIDDTEQIRFLDELRMVMSCLLGSMTRLEAATREYKTGAMIDRLVATRCFGTLVPIDNGLFSIKIHKVGTCHIYIDAEMAAHLNDILSMLYPHSIPSKFRTRNPIKKSSFVASSEMMIPISIMSTLMRLFKDVTRSFHKRSEIYPYLEGAVQQLPHAVYYTQTQLPEGTVVDDSWRVVAKALGGVLYPTHTGTYLVLNYPPKDLIGPLSQMGTMPNLKDFQFFPTQGKIASDFSSRVYAHHDNDHLSYLEPSAGHAGLLEVMDFIPKTQIKVVELATLFAGILRCKGYNTTQCDFISFARETYAKSVRFDRVVMNPPFCNNQAFDHTMAAYHLLKEGGKLFAILPTSLKDAFDNLGATIVKSPVYSGAFDGTSIDTFILEIHR